LFVLAESQETLFRQDIRDKRLEVVNINLKIAHPSQRHYLRLSSG